MKKMKDAGLKAAFIFDKHVKRSFKSLLAGKSTY